MGNSIKNTVKKRYDILSEKDHPLISQNGYIYVVYDFSNKYGTYIFDCYASSNELPLIDHINRKHKSNKILFSMEVKDYKKVMAKLNLKDKLNRIFDMNTMESFSPTCDLDVQDLIKYMKTKCSKYVVKN